MQEKDSNIIAKGIVKAVFSLFSLLLLLWFLYKIKIIIVYLIIAFVVSLMGRPLKRFLIKRFKFKDGLAAGITLLIFVLIFVLLLSGFIPMIYQQGKNLSLLDFDQFQIKMQHILDNINIYLQAKHIKIFDDFSLSKILSKINLTIVPQMVNSLLSILGNITIGFFAVSFITFFMLKDSNLTSDFVFKFIPDDDKEKYMRLIDHIKNILSRYFLGLVIQITILFTFYTILLNIFAVENATLIALFAALLNLVPYIGPIAGWVLMVSLSLTSSINHVESIQMLHLVRNISIGYILIQMWDAFVDQPLIFSKSVKAHPLEIFLVIMISGTLFGVVGMIIAVPSYTMLRLLSKEFYQEYKSILTIW